jgi:ABC-type antimicrobial peptide transport system permease subunit
MGPASPAWWPAARARLDWAVAGLAVASPFSAWFAKLSGEAFRRRLIHDRVSSPAVLAKIAQHQSYGTATLWWTIGLSLVALALVYYGWRPPSTIPPSLLLGAAVVATVLGLIVGYYVFRTGDTGAHIAWSGY